MAQTPNIDILFLVPEHVKGSQNDAIADKSLSNDAKAGEAYRALCSNLLKVSQWSRYAGGEEFVFELTAPDGTLKADPLQLGDRIRIQLPGPKDDLGKGYDWVEVMRLEQGTSADIEYFMLELSPCDCPYTSAEETAHFYWENASNTFVAAKQGQTVQFSVHGRNEVPNIGSQPPLAKIRNFFVAHGGIFGGSKIQWEVFSKNIIADEA